MKILQALVSPFLIYAFGLTWGSFVLFLRIIGRVKVTGRAHLFPKEKGVFVLSNHLSIMDFALPALYFPEYLLNPFRYLPRAAVERKYFPFLGFFKVIPIDRRPGDSKRNDAAVEKMRSLLMQGKAVLLWPEGTRLFHNKGKKIFSKTKKKEMGHFKPGILKVMEGCNCDVVLVWLEGVDKVLPVGKIIPRFWRAPIVIRISEPISGELTVTELENKMLELADNT